MDWYVIGLADPPQVTVVAESALPIYLARGWEQLSDGIADRSELDLEQYAPPTVDKPEAKTKARSQGDDN